MKNFQMLISWWCFPLEAILNQIFYNSDALKISKRYLVNRVVRIVLYEINLTFFVIFGELNLVITSSYCKEVDCSLVIWLKNFQQIKKNKQLAEIIQSCNFTGDLQLLKQIVHILELTDWHLSEFLSPYVGDLLAYFIAEKIDRSFDALFETLHKLHHCISHGITDVYCLAPSFLEFAYFKEEVEKISDQVDSLQERFLFLKRCI